MCGILGELRLQGDLDLERMTVQREALVHRGPDSAGLWCADDGRVALAHRRLAILDLSPAGHQPMVHPVSGCAITFNGEIFNFHALRERLAARGHAFRSQSDTEVILSAYQAWGPRCVDELHGQFAFAIADPARRQLFLARDRAGEKPLFFRAVPGRFAFASEAKALLADPTCPRRVHVDALNEYFAFGYVTGSRTLWHGIERLLPGHCATVPYDTAIPAISRYWALPEPSTGPLPADPAGQVDALQVLLRDAVRRQLVADVPVGILLSGGVDSSVVAAIAAEAAGTRVRTFTARFEGHPGFDEGPFARLVAEHIGAEHHELPTAAPDAEVLQALVRQFDDPIADSSMIPTYLVSREIRRHATVALGGDGGDELFGGYRRYPALLSQERIRSAVPSPVRALLPYAFRLLPARVPGRGVAEALAGPHGAGLQHAGRLFRTDERQALAPVIARMTAERLRRPEHLRAWRDGRGSSILQQATALDFGSYLVDDVLVKVDRASMLTSLEVRAPFLDTAVVEFAFRLPDALRASRRERKILLRQLGARILPASLDLRRKQGFSIPIAAWARTAWAPLIDGALEAPSQLVAPEALRQLQRRLRAGEDVGDRLFSLLFLALWEREYRVSDLVETP